MAIMAHQRSGSHFLGSAIGSCPEIKYVGEIFYYPPVDIQDVVDGIDRVAHGADVICVDTKYNQITPPLEEYLARPEVKVIHLIRRDRLAAYFSGALHTWRGEGHEGEEIPIFDFDLSVFNEIEEEVTLHQRRLGYLTNLQLCYEDLTHRGRDTTILPDWASRGICNLAGVDVCSLTTPLGKEAPVHYLCYLAGVPLWLQNLIQEAYR
jgi:hypothetical protein